MRPALHNYQLYQTTWWILVEREHPKMTSFQVKYFLPTDWEKANLLHPFASTWKHNIHGKVDCFGHVFEHFHPNMSRLKWPQLSSTFMLRMPPRRRECPFFPSIHRGETDTQFITNILRISEDIDYQSLQSQGSVRTSLTRQNEA